VRNGLADHWRRMVRSAECSSQWIGGSGKRMKDSW
jgi:hypothetical protein